jgi:LacI family transcriptional regulator
MPVTIEDVAKHSGVSIRTVSRVINKRPDVAAATRQRIEIAIAELGYRPNTLARSMITGRTMTIGVVLPDIANPFFGHAVRGCEDILNASGYSILLCNTDEDVDKEQEYLSLLIDRRVDGLIIWGSRSACDTLEATVDANLPVVTVDCHEFCGHVVNIDVENEKGAAFATQHLIELGHRRIGFLAGPANRLTAKRRLQGYKNAIQEAGYELLIAPLIGETVPSVLQGYQAAKELIAHPNPPTAIFAYNDLMATGAYLIARQVGRKIPDNLAIVGFDDVLMAGMIDPPLTTVRIPQYKLGSLTGEMVLNLLNNTITAQQRIEYPVELVVRGSSVKKTLPENAQENLVNNILATLLNDHPSNTSR